MTTIGDWYAGSLRPKVQRAAGRGAISREQAERLESLMADLVASERSARRLAPPRPRPRRR